jgi:hypothetical protein
LNEESIMRRDQSEFESAEAQLAESVADVTPDVTPETSPVAAAPSPDPAAAISAEAARPRKLGPIGRLMALPEPQRTQGLEQAVQSGQITVLRSLTGNELLVRHGEHVLVVPSTPKPFTAGHAIHILWYHADQVEEQEG